MSLFSDNIKSLRAKRKISQEKVAESLLITRGRYAKYEDGTSEAPYEILKKIAHYYQISIDLLLSVDVRKIPIDDLLKLENNRLLLPITVDAAGNDFVEIVTQKAKAGYLNGYGDPEYIESLQQMALPFLGPGKHRGFPVEGDSMPPHEDGSIIIGRYVERLGEVMDGKTYILITKNEGMVYKRLNKNKKNALVLESDNHFYPNYEVKASDILEIWEYECNIGRTDKKQELSETQSMKELLLELKRDVLELKNKA
ncbi:MULTISPECIES: helix-turn-helix domain-containing protein [unclassified Flavobacterium]|uniref:XRE family transcriptional regulator n=1 Tax=unclassified Flavobacterium TaxID=196869 RepID=UPI0005804DC6|nr:MULTISPECIES: helix-turn-helix domain-containing protein [unclassified Flavobacterium]KIA95643.1 XRE family transcriptional regulator [Flavobacterium sp. KMS]OUL62826.1 XRE family transcriptional regulator [Flavobacterium sp. AJR]